MPWASTAAKADMELRDAMQRIALEFPSYGWPRMTAELRRRGWAVNHKRVYRLMREDNLSVFAQAQVHPDHRFPSYVVDLSESGCWYESDRYQPTVGCRYHVHTFVAGVRIFGGDFGRLLPVEGWGGR